MFEFGAKETIFTGLGNIGIDTGALQTVLDQLFNVNISGDGFKGIFDSLKNGVVQAVNIVLQILPTLINYIQTLAPMVILHQSRQRDLMEDLV